MEQDKQKMVQILYKARPEAQKVEKIKKLTACKGRHTYINKGNGLWKCNCGKQLV